MGTSFRLCTAKSIFAADDLLVDFLLKDAFAVDAKERFAVFFVADGVDNFELEFHGWDFLL
jgi:hypothetical protein